jgi:hypothetical protein
MLMVTLSIRGNGVVERFQHVGGAGRARLTPISVIFENGFADYYVERVIFESSMAVWKRPEAEA